MSVDHERTISISYSFSIWARHHFKLTYAIRENPSRWNVFVHGTKHTLMRYNFNHLPAPPLLPYHAGHRLICCVSHVSLWNTRLFVTLCKKNDYSIKCSTIVWAYSFLLFLKVHKYSCLFSASGVLSFTQYHFHNTVLLSARFALFLFFTFIKQTFFRP